MPIKKKLKVLCPTCAHPCGYSKANDCDRYVSIGVAADMKQSVAKLSKEFENKYGEIALLKASISVLNKVLVDNELTSKYELQKAMKSELLYRHRLWKGTRR